ncbi:hypothetical protein Ahy_A06g030775 [Arachis hypogaea]|uniref:Uncharacterized protein n=2 Tax=Arachis TaxID=3817 RepID=A0A445CXC3_ARAHY|nr:hypothetical protein Ahy_A06g030775 [Arachis hypogaea]
MAGKVISPNNNNNNKTLLTTQQNSDFQDNKNCSPPSSSSSLVHLPILSNDINNFSSNLSLDLIHQQLYSPQFMNLEIDGANSRSNKNNNSSNIEGSTSSSSLALLDYKGGSSLLEEEKQHGVGDDNDESNKEFLMDLGFDGVPTYYDIVNGLNCHERVVGEFSQSISSCCYSEWVDFNCAEIKPH